MLDRVTQGLEDFVRGRQTLRPKLRTRIEYRRIGTRDKVVMTQEVWGARGWNTVNASCLPLDGGFYLRSDGGRWNAVQAQAAVDTRQRD